MARGKAAEIVSARTLRRMERRLEARIDLMRLDVEHVAELVGLARLADAKVAGVATVLQAVDQRVGHLVATVMPGLSEFLREYVKTSTELETTRYAKLVSLILDRTEATASLNDLRDFRGEVGERLAEIERVLGMDRKLRAGVEPLCTETYEDCADIVHHCLKPKGHEGFLHGSPDFWWGGYLKPPIRRQANGEPWDEAPGHVNLVHTV